MILGFDARVAVVALAAYAAGSTAGSLAVAALWRRALASERTVRPRAIASRLLAVRAVPAMAGIAVAVIATLAFALLEPPIERERVGAPILLVAVFGAALLVSSGARLLVLARAAKVLARQWSASPPLRLEGCHLDVLEVATPFPVVALTGYARPRLFLASCVADACTAEELSAVVAHELAHASARDNLGRAFVSSCPDALGWLPASRALVAAWSEAAEQAADEEASGADVERRLALASALVKVARLATAAGRPPLPASALFRGEPIADRVRRLTSPPPRVDPRAETTRTRKASLLAAAITAAAIAALAVSLPRIYGWVEAAIRLGD